MPPGGTLLGMGNIGGGEILVILLVALIFLGPEKLPEVARQVGKVMGEVRKVKDGFQREMRDAMRVIEDSATELDVFKEPSAADAVPAVADTSTADTVDGPELPADAAHGGDR